MDEQGDGPSDPEAAGPSPGLPQLPPQVHSDADELRRLIDAGAGSPEELRALAARIREHRELEESLWRQEVKPALLESKKRRLRLSDLRDRPAGGVASDGSSLGVGLFVIAAVLVLLVVATQASALFVLVPVVGVLVFAYRQGRREVAAPGKGGTTEEPPD
jgi:hypothetical protein